ncbi:unnamed protein product [Closterium sp. Naga37s-1]|nr:unnamed protein product [Closterium sp. Naga37s-1]
MSNEPLLPTYSPQAARPAPPAAAAAISNTLSNASSHALSHALSNASSDAASEHLQYDDESRHVPVSSGGNGGDVAVPINRLTSVEWAEMGALVAETTPECADAGDERAALPEPAPRDGHGAPREGRILLPYIPSSFSFSPPCSPGALMLAMSGLLFPNLLHATGTELHENDSELALSRLAAVLMLVAYFAYIYFQLFTHKDLFEGGPDGDGGADGDAEGGGEAEEEEEHSVLGFWGGVFWLALVSALISVISDYLVNSVDGAAEEWNVPVSGLCVVVLPLVNNVTEHTSAILFGIRNKLDVSLSIAVGSSIQLAMFLIPLAVLGGWAMDVPMDLNFHRFETCTLFITVLATVLTLHEGSANWLKGFMFVLMYLILAATFFNHKEDYLEPQAAAAVADAAAGAAAAAAAAAGGVQTIASPVVL